MVESPFQKEEKESMSTHDTFMRYSDTSEARRK
jgi:hypothetical protein